THHNGSSNRIIIDPMRPIHVEEVIYFWDKQFLPEMNTSCTQFEMNGRGNGTICDPTKQQICSNEIAESLFQDKITFDSGISPSRLVWLCPHCCDLKCCLPVSSYIKLIIIFSLIVILLSLSIIMHR
ncbi:hypothetical protein PENTCL1PPCAC_17624, partial [Pristionchus entomophagus]